jgi:hypothetical protein
MAKRFSDIEKPLVTNQPSLEERLKEYPELKGKIEAMLAIIENVGGDVEKAAEAERRIIEELRQMGSEVFHSWARRQQQKKEQEYDPKPGVNRKGKKALLVHPAGDHRNRRTDLHPRSAGAGDSTLLRMAEVECRGYSGALQRNHDGFGGRWCLCRIRGQAEGTLWD